jgi:4-methyl-5(b-hydroxyethyl)-thiazole monophosphate biosynthesis
MSRVLVPLAHGFEEIEAVTLIDILRRADIEVLTAGLAEGAAKGAHGVQLIPDATLDQALQQEFDMVVLPGGQPGTNHLKADARIIALLQKMAQAGKYTCAICAAPAVLGQAGLLNGKQATSYPNCLDHAATGAQPNDAAVVHDGKVITSRGPGTALDFALDLVEELHGKARRNEVEGALAR